MTDAMLSAKISIEYSPQVAFSQTWLVSHRLRTACLLWAWRPIENRCLLRCAWEIARVCCHGLVQWSGTRSLLEIKGLPGLRNLHAN